jgi:hypothetical protein
MEYLLEQKLQSLHRLSVPAQLAPRCKICGNSTNLFDVVDFNKFCSDRPYGFGVAGIPVSYFRCQHCQFLFTNFIDDWTPEEVARHIYNDDYILVDPEYKEARPFAQAKEMSRILDGCQQLRILDYGSGSGKFAKYMTEFGFAFVTSYDPFSNPVRPEGLFHLVTAFEVVEHSPHPIETFTEMKNFTEADGTVLVGQTIQPPNISEIRGVWWYLAPRNGHVSTYSDFTFFSIAKKIDLLYRRNYRRGGHFAFTRRSLSPILEAAIARVGPNFSICVLGAPGNEAELSDQWHKLEPWHDDVRFRWTAKDYIAWDGCVLEEGKNRIEIPFVMEVVDGFAQACRLCIDRRDLPTTVEANRLVAEVNLSMRGSHTVSLRTPLPRSPQQMGLAPDPRSLGFAVAVQSPDVAVA